MSALTLAGFAAQTEGFSDFDRQFSRFIREQHLRHTDDPEQADLLGALACLLAYSQSSGHVCLDLENPPHFQVDDQFHPIELPADLSRQLDKCLGECLSLDSAGKMTPLILSRKDSPRLYFHRYWSYERGLEASLRRLMKRRARKSIKPAAATRAILASHPKGSSQHRAIDNALRSQFSLIAGGPGTGKTTLAVNILAAKLSEKPDLQIALAAPTGKAASRLMETIDANVGKLRDRGVGNDTIKQIRGLASMTIHRLLGSVFNSPDFKHNSRNPLPHDLIIVDEASMIDLPLMAKLLAAVDDHSSLLIIGDRNQLPSVEVGSIFGDMIRAQETQAVVTTLTENFRAKDSPRIIELCNKVNSEDCTAEDVFDLLQSTADRPQVHWRNVEDASGLADLITLAARAYRTIFQSDASAMDKLHATQSFRILTALREGPFGMHGLNRMIGEIIGNDDQLLIVTRNDPATDLFNGDIGVQYTVDNKDRRVCFPGKPNPISILRIPQHELAYAMTTHRAQGSEFDTVHIVLPPDTACPLLTREWLYTAISRAKSSVTLWASQAAIRKCMTSNTLRNSGLFR